MIIVPKTLASEVGDAINVLLKESDRYRNWDDVEVQTVLREIKKLQKIDARVAFVQFGALAAICGNVGDVVTYYKKALLLPGEPETKHEFWVSHGKCRPVQQGSRGWQLAARSKERLLPKDLEPSCQLRPSPCSVGSPA